MGLCFWESPQDSGDIPAYGFGVRHIQVLLIFLFNLLFYTMAIALPVCIVAMRDPSANKNYEIPTFPEWHAHSITLASFSLGYASTQMLGGHFSKQYGFKIFMIFAMGINSLIYALIPTIVMYFGENGLVVCNFIQGLAQGFTTCMIPDFISEWIPSVEKTSLGNFIFAAYGPGFVLGIQIAGILSETSWGWPAVFYVLAISGVIWMLFMSIFGSNSPKLYKNITDEEINFIMHEKDINKKFKIPWRKIFKSKAVWALWIAHCGSTLMQWIISMEFPTFIHKAFGYSVRKCGDILSIGFLISWALSIVASEISEYLINYNILSTGGLRKICNTIATYGPSLCLILFGCINRKDMDSAMSFLIVIFVTMSTRSCASIVNYNDISVNFCGILFGTGGCASNLLTFLPAFLIKHIVKIESDIHEWAKVFLVIAVIVVVTNLCYIFFGSGSIQDWDKVEDNEEKMEYSALLDSRSTKEKNNNGET